MNNQKEGSYEQTRCTVAVTNAVLPFMRQQRASRIIMMGSLAGLLGIGGMGYTSAVKHALEGYAEALQGEVAAFGVYVSLVEPSYFRTDIYDRRIESEQRPRFNDYDRLRDTVAQTLLEDAQKGDDPAKVASLVLKIAQTPRPRLRYPVGKDAGLIWRMKRYMPEVLFLRGLHARLTG